MFEYAGWQTYLDEHMIPCLAFLLDEKARFDSVVQVLVDAKDAKECPFPVLAYVG